MATINYVQKDGALLDKKIVQGALTSAIGVPNVDLVNGGKSFTLRTINTSGFKPHTRNKGFNEGSYKDDPKVYTMGQDRDIEFYIDKQDVDETDEELAMANISNQFITNQVTPELDAYRFSKLAKTAAETDKHSVEGEITNENAYAAIKDGLKLVRKYGQQNLTAFVSTNTMDALERSKEFNRQITNQNVGLTALESRVTSVDGVQLIEVWDPARFMTAYDFADGFKPADDAQEINFLIVNKPSIIQVVKENAVFLFAPGEHSQGDGYLYQNRLYHDLFVREQSKDGLFVNLSPKAEA